MGWSIARGEPTRTVFTGLRVVSIIYGSSGGAATPRRGRQEPCRQVDCVDGNLGGLARHGISRFRPLPTSSRPSSASPPRLTARFCQSQGIAYFEHIGPVVHYRGMTRARLDHDLAQLEADVGGETGNGVKATRSLEGKVMMPSRASGACRRWRPPSAYPPERGWFSDRRRRLPFGRFRRRVLLCRRRNRLPRARRPRGPAWCRRRNRLIQLVRRLLRDAEGASAGRAVQQVGADRLLCPREV